MLRAGSLPFAALGVILGASTGCSFAFVSGPPSPLPAPPARASCTIAPLVPIVDTAIAVLTAIGAVYFITEDNLLGAGIQTGLALGFGGSAVTGWRRVGRCERARGGTAP
ncbi:MAG: hypothetical protein H0X17_10415 [Deltaproteobacteria bacterium]|nr:hypothetical protein [Deltaproteobacteria bacterium]